MLQELLSYAIRVIIIFLFTYFAARILSKKAISEMSAYELIGIILMANVAVTPLISSVVPKTILGVGILAALTALTARLSLINKLTPILEHTPTIVIKNGQVNMSALRSNALSLNQLMGLLREKGFDKVTDVEFGILEPTGNLSAIPKSQKRPVQTADLNIPTKYEGLTIPLVMDGAIIERNLKHVRLDKRWLLEELKKQGISRYQTEVALAELDTTGNLLVSKTSPN